MKKVKEKRKKKDRAYSPIKVCKEIALVQWPSIGELFKQSSIVICFVAMMAAFFIACEAAIGVVMKTAF